MARWKELYRVTNQNTAISANSQEVFGQDVSSREAKNKYGSFNRAIITIRKSSGAVIKIDGLDSQKYEITQPGTFTIDSDEGQFFEWIEIEDGDGTGISAGLITSTLAIAEGIDNA